MGGFPIAHQPLEPLGETALEVGVGLSLGGGATQREEAELVVGLGEVEVELVHPPLQQHRVAADPPVVDLEPRPQLPIPGPGEGMLVEGHLEDRRRQGLERHRPGGAQPDLEGAEEQQPWHQGEGQAPAHRGAGRVLVAGGHGATHGTGFPPAQASAADARPGAAHGTGG